MRILTLSCLLLITIYSSNSRAQNGWTQKSDFAGTPRGYGVGFSINDKGYIGTGQDGSPKKDFWEYDPVTDTWTQKADFGGIPRFSAVGFSIGDKGYIGTGQSANALLKDFWQYDPELNTWMQKANFRGTARKYATGFSINGKGYLGTGLDSQGRKSDFWEYDPDNNNWTSKAKFEGGARFGAIGLSILNKGYIAAGENGGANLEFDLWGYDPATNTWTLKAIIGSVHAYGTAFSIGSKGYIYGGFVKYGGGYFIEYDAQSNSWNAKTPFGGKIVGAAGFSIGNKGYIGTGVTEDGYQNDFWEFNSEEFTLPSDKHPGTSVSFSSTEPSVTSFEIYPNPSTANAIIHFTLSKSSGVSIRIYDVNGKEMATWLNGEMTEGNHQLSFDVSSFAKGIYFVRIMSESGMQNEKLVVE